VYAIESFASLLSLFISLRLSKR